MRGYVVQRAGRFYAVIYEGRDPISGRERRRWHAAGTNRADAERLATVLAAEARSTEGPPGLSLGRYLLHAWLPRKRVSLRPSTWDGYRATSSSTSSLGSGPSRFADCASTTSMRSTPTCSPTAAPTGVVGSIPRLSWRST